MVDKILSMYMVILIVILSLIFQLQLDNETCVKATVIDRRIDADNDRYFYIRRSSGRYVEELEINTNEWYSYADGEEVEICDAIGNVVPLFYGYQIKER